MVAEPVPSPASARPPGLLEATKLSTTQWQDDLQSLFNHAKDRFPDVVWELVGEESRPGDEVVEEVWGHKAIVYARAPPSFQARYFSFRPAPAASPSPYPPSPTGAQSAYSLTLPPPIDYSSRSHSPSRSPSPFRALSPSPSTNGGQAALLRLTTSISPVLFSNELEYLYTGKGLGEAFEFLFDSSDTRAKDAEAAGGEEQDESRIDKLRKDLVFMWRSRLYSDVRIALAGDALSTATHNHEGMTAVFSSHRFILVSRSPYFYAQLISFATKPPSPSEPLTLTLPSPPFTPASLHFTLGFLYTGTLSFSNRTFDLLTSFHILLASTYLSLTSLYSEIQARIVQEQMHGLFHAFLEFAEYERITSGKWGTGGCRCRQCARRAPRVLEFAVRPDVQNPYLERGARRALVGLFGEGWCTAEFATLPQKTKDGLMKGLAKRTTPLNVFPLLFASHAAMARLNNIYEAWADGTREMVLAARKVVDDVLCRDADKCFEQPEWLAMMDHADTGVSFDDGEKVEWVTESLRRGLNEGNAGSLYQVLVSQILLRPNPENVNEPLLGRTSHVRVQIEQMRGDILAWMKKGKRWTGVVASGGFEGMEGWAVAEVAGEIDEPVADLLRRPSHPHTSPNANKSPSSASTRKSTLQSDMDTASMHSSLRASVLNRNAVMKGTTSSSAASNNTSAAGGGAGGDGASVRSVARSVVSTRSAVSTATASTATGTAVGQRRRVVSPGSTATGTTNGNNTAGGANGTRSVSRTGTRVKTGKDVADPRPDSKLTPSVTSASSAASAVSSSVASRASVASEVSKASDAPSRQQSEVSRASTSTLSSSASLRSSSTTATGDEEREARAPLLGIRAGAGSGSPPAARTGTGTGPRTATGAAAAAGMLPRPKSSAESVSSVRSHASTIRRTGSGGPGPGPSTSTSAAAAAATRPISGAPSLTASSVTSASASRPTSSLSTSTTRSDASSTFKTAPESAAPTRGRTLSSASTLSTVSARSAKGAATSSSSAAPPPVPPVPKSPRIPQKSPKVPQAQLQSPGATRQRTLSGVSVGSTASRSSVGAAGRTKRVASGGTGAGDTLSPEIGGDGKAARRSPSASSVKSSASTTTSGRRVVVKRSGTTETPEKTVPDAHKKSAGSVSTVAAASNVKAADGPAKGRAGVLSAEDKKKKNAAAVTSKSSDGGSTVKGSLRKKESNETITLPKLPGTAATQKQLPQVPPPTPPPRTPLKENIPLSPKGATLDIGIPCIISSKRKRFRAFARYIGEVEGEKGPWVGVEVPVGDAWANEKLEDRQWNDGSWGGIKYFDVGSGGSEWGDEDIVTRDGRGGYSSVGGGGGGAAAVTRKRRLDWVNGQKGMKREGDQLYVDRTKRFRSASPAVSDVSNSEYRGLFVRPQQVLYVVDAVGPDL
ncbi:hypothetical protein BD410DRAFT_902200 [Rickenella mellea]|uniref:BTB domain-containing protein n=1 Tax=Rickenella mellea TaxID=50990 RepID=A0A4Y7PMU0_9AGAM|nr:hypothetical protein BD410DRAFT_902200 [Rickenella mellea]